ncbi:MAG: EamA family transporter [Pyrinomonadaceae bacterium]
MSNIAANKDSTLLSRPVVGAIQVIASAVGYGLLGIFGKRAYEAGMKPGELLALRFILASTALWAYVLIARRSVLRLSIRQLLACVCLGVFGYAVFSTLYFRALEGLSASLTVLLLYTNPVIVTVGSWLLFKERVTRAQWLALPVTLAGLVMLLWGGLSIGRPIAIVFALGSAIIYSAYILATSRLLSSVNPLAAGLYIMTAATVALVLWTPSALQRAHELNGAAWGSITGLALISTVGPMVLFLMGLEKLTNTETSLLNAVEPVTATVAAAVLLGERLTLTQVMGGLLVLFALAISTLFRRSTALSKEITHRTTH